MKDLYRRNKLRPRESDPVKIHNSAGSEEDQEAAYTILLNPERKAHYDRVHTTLSQIGYVRRHLGLAGKSDWRARHGDFLSQHEVPAVRPARTRKAFRLPRWHLPHLPAIPWTSLVTWPLMVAAFFSLLPLVYLILLHDPGAVIPDAPDSRASLSVYTVSPQVPVRAGPDNNAAQLTELPEFFELRMYPHQTTPDWALVQVDAERSGWVRRNELAAGSAEAAQLEKCRQYGLWRPQTGQHLASGKTGVHTLVVANPSAQDALVKLKDHEGRTQVFFYVRGGDTAEVASIPEGRFQLQYAIGSDFSPACGRFLSRMQSVQESRFVTFSKRADEGSEHATAVTRILRARGENLTVIPNQSF